MSLLFILFSIIFQNITIIFPQPTVSPPKTSPRPLTAPSPGRTSDCSILKIWEGEQWLVGVHLIVLTSFVYYLVESINIDSKLLNETCLVGF
jgi:hypothetical protein